MISTDLTGRVFGRLRVLELATKDKNSQTIWLCQCECGYRPAIRRNDLVSGKSRSCGCSKKNKGGKK